MTIKYFFSALLAGAFSLSAHAILPQEAKFHNETQDTLRINRLLTMAAKEKSPEARVAIVGKEFLGTPYVAGTLEGDEETVTINLDELDCTTFVETALVMAATAGEGHTSWRDYVYNLEKFRYRGGTVNGYASRLHYFSDWIVDNVHRGNVKEYTTRMPINDWTVKTIDFMSTNRDKYPALADSTQFERVKNIEIGYRNHRFPFIKSSRLSNKEIIASLKEGDIVAITTKVPGLDVSHMGIIIMKNGVPHLMHASSKLGKVVIDELTLAEYLKRNGGSGIRIVRLAEQ